MLTFSEKFRRSKLFIDIRRLTGEIMFMTGETGWRLTTNSKFQRDFKKLILSALVTLTFSAGPILKDRI